MQVLDLYNILNDMYCFKNQESFDNSGKQVVFEKDKVNSILISLDVDNSVIDRAVNENCNVIITHHPLIFSQIKFITDSDSKNKLIMRLISERISIISVHTNLDKKYPYELGKMIGLQNQKIFVSDQHDSDLGFGSVGKFDTQLTLKEVAALLKDKLQADYILYAGEDNIEIKTAAVVNGSGSSFYTEALKRRVDCIITGDVRYHSAKDAEIYGIPILDAGHYYTEKMFKKIIKKDLQDKLETNSRNITLIVYEDEANPLKIFTGE